jgi:Zn finger protein HypA/HybF involved in hydrogenase expression
MLTKTDCVIASGAKSCSFERRLNMAEKGAETEKKRLGREGQDNTLRCLNCFNRVVIPPKVERYTCPHCGVEFIIGWRGIGARQAKIRGVPIPGKHI